MSIPYKEVLKLVLLPSEQQVEAWNKLLEEQRAPKVPWKRGKEIKPGPKKLTKLYHAVDGLTARSSEFRKGLKLGLAVALGKKRWPFDASNTKKEQSQHGNEEG
jgi:hypothetical protein